MRNPGSCWEDNLYRFLSALRGSKQGESVMPANPTLECSGPVQRRKASRVQMMAIEFLRANTTLTIAFVGPSCPGKVRRELWMWGSHYLLLLYLFPSRGRISIAYKE